MLFPFDFLLGVSFVNNGHGSFLTGSKPHPNRHLSPSPIRNECPRHGLKHPYCHANSSHLTLQFLLLGRGLRVDKQEGSPQIYCFLTSVLYSFPAVRGRLRRKRRHRVKKEFQPDTADWRSLLYLCESRAAINYYPTHTEPFPGPGGEIAAPESEMSNLIRQVPPDVATVGGDCLGNYIGCAVLDANEENFFNIFFVWPHIPIY